MTLSNTLEEPFLYQDFVHAASTICNAIDNAQYYVMLTGDSGCGKTTLLRYLHRTIDKNTYTILYLCQSQSSPPMLSRVLADALHLPQYGSRSEISRLLITTLKSLPTRLLLWIDEAQLIRNDMLQELRVLAEADLNGPPLFAVILCALPSLKERLLAPEHLALWRRVYIRIPLRGLLHEEVVPFVKHCFGDTAAQRFSAEALSVIFEKSRGLPAMIKNYCSQCFCNTCVEQQVTKNTAIDILESFDNYY